jgi:thiamine biosynthesis lipoprotein
MIGPPLVGPLAEARFHAMGTEAHVIVIGGDGAHLERARELVADLESRWSRFLPDSELSRLNVAAGTPVIVAPITFELIRRAVDGWRLTAGRFDPTILPELVAAGYDRTFDRVARDGQARVAPSAPPPGCANIGLDPVTQAVTLPPGVALDLGGIGKGFAADVVTAELLQAGAAGVCVNIGGDVRVRGDAPSDGGWIVEVASEPGVERRHPDLRLGVADGAVATTSSRRRVWRRAGDRLHHVIDPATGRPLDHPPTSATVVAADGWRAETLTKAVFMAGARGDAEKLLVSTGATGFLVDAEGTVHRFRGLEDFLA